MVGALSLAGCASPTAIEDFSGLPQVPVAQAAGAEEEAGAELEELEVDEGETVVVYLDYGDRLALVTWGSSTCPVVGSDIVVTEDQHSGNSVRIETVPIPDDAVCTSDFVPHTTIFGTPETHDDDAAVERRGQRRGDRRPREVAAGHTAERAHSWLLPPVQSQRFSTVPSAVDQPGRPGTCRSAARRSARIRSRRSAG